MRRFLCSRRTFLCGGAALLASPASAEEGIFIVSRERVLNETEAARALWQAERRMTAALQALIDRTGEELSAEEVELTQIRTDLSDEEFETRAADFDRRRRLARQVAQERAQALQRSFQAARNELLSALPAAIEVVRREVDARLILDADQVIAATGDVNLTDRVIAVFNAQGPRPAIPEINVSEPILQPPTEPGDLAEPSDQ